MKIKYWKRKKIKTINAGTFCFLNNNIKSIMKFLEQTGGTNKYALGFLIGRKTAREIIIEKILIPASQQRKETYCQLDYEVEKEIFKKYRRFIVGYFTYLGKCPIETFNSITNLKERDRLIKAYKMPANSMALNKELKIQIICKQRHHIGGLK